MYAQQQKYTCSMLVPNLKPLHTHILNTRYECYSGCRSGGALLNRHWSSPRNLPVFSPAFPLAGNQGSLLIICRLTHLSVLSYPSECYPTYNPLCSLLCLVLGLIACEDDASCWFYSPPLE